ncbi:MAG: hypothetical protein IH889_01415 [Planctomycetes bacterium]|nr:hypothetical protein [Planctomycetota bacterium]
MGIAWTGWIFPVRTEDDPIEGTFAHTVADFRGGCIDFIVKHEAFRGETLRRRIAEALLQSHR